MQLEEINEKLESIVQMLEQIDLEKTQGKTSEEIRKIVDDPINTTNAFIHDAVREELFSLEHLEKLVSIYSEARSKLATIDLEKSGEDIQYVIEQIEKKAEEFEGKKSAYETASKEYDPQKSLELEEQEKKSLEDELDNDTSNAEGMELLSKRCKKQIKQFQEAYEKYLEAMEKANSLDENIPEPEDEYKKEIDEIDKEIRNLPPNTLTDAQKDGLENDIRNAEQELKILEDKGIVGERPDPLLDKSQESDWNKRDSLKREIEKNKAKLNSNTSDYKKLNELKDKKAQKLKEWRSAYKQKHNVICKSQKTIMNKSIKAIRKDLGRKNKYSDKFVDYMEEILNDAETNENYAKFNDAIGGLENLKQSIAEKKGQVKQKQKDVNNLRLGIEQSNAKQESATTNNTIEGNVTIQNPPAAKDSSVAIKQLTYLKRRKMAYDKMKAATGKRGFRPILWLKSLSIKQIEAWEQGVFIEKQQPTEEQIVEAKKHVESRRDAFAKSLLYSVVQQPGNNITEADKQRAYKATIQMGEHSDNEK